MMSFRRMPDWLLKGVPAPWWKLAFVIVLLPLFGALLAGCSDQRALQQKLAEVGPQRLREETIAVCRAGFSQINGEKIPEANWPATVRAFAPLSLWAEPDGAYLLLDSDASGERGIYLPRFVSEKDPVCGPTLTHEKLAEGVYWYERKRG